MSINMQRLEHDRRYLELQRDPLRVMRWNLEAAAKRAGYKQHDATGD